MLLELYIENFAIIDGLNLTLGPGLNVLTGETGAGKSIVIDAVQILLGHRASTDYIRAGCDKAVIQGLFHLPARGGEPPRQLAVARELNSSGRHIARIDERPVTVAAVRSATGNLVDIHSQHEHQTLFDGAAQRSFLDSWAGAPVADLKEEVSRAYGEFRRAWTELESLAGDGRERARMVDLYAFQVDEIDGADLKPGEDEELQERRRTLAHAERLRDSLGQAYSALYGGGADPGGSAAHEAVGTAIGALQAVLALGIDGGLKDLVEDLFNVQARVEDAARRIRDRLDDAMVDPGDLARVEERLDSIAGLKRKYGDTIEEILRFRDEAARELERLQGASERAEQLEEELDRQAAELGEICRRLHRRRSLAAPKLADAVEKQLHQLGMDGARFQINVTIRHDSRGVPVGDAMAAVDAAGADEVEFLVSANPGEPMRPIAQAASGGELSRIMLALKSLIAAGEGVPTVIFDEVDAGIGGHTASVVAARLAEIARHHQVICVTHLAAIAAHAHHHFAVRKTGEGGRTVTRVEKLDEAGREQEIARMLGGSKGDVDIAHARALLARAGAAAAKTPPGDR